MANMLFTSQRGLTNVVVVKARMLALQAVFPDISAEEAPPSGVGRQASHVLLHS
jgi:hypothetical protein